MKTFEDYKIDINGLSGAEVRTICPECSPSRKKSNLKDLCVNTINNTWFCHHCSWKGGLSSNEKIYTVPEFIEIEELPKKVIEYFKERGISEKVLKENKINYGPVWMPAENKEVNAIQFPFYKNGVVVNIKYRDGKKNFRQAKNAEKCLYGFDNMKNKSDTLVITEGEIDALSFKEAGIYEVVSIPDGAPSANANSYTTKFDFLKSAESYLKKYKKVILAVDDDPPGKRAEEELARRIGCERCYKVNYPTGCKDANEVLKNHGRSAVKDIVKNAKPFPVAGLFLASDFKSRVELVYELGFKKGSSTGWGSVDEYFTVRPGELTIITGIPGSGKSNFLDNLMVNLINNGEWKFAVYSPENWPMERHIQSLSEKILEKPFSHNFGDKFKRMEKHEIEDVTNFLDKNVYFIQPPEDEDPTIDKIINLAKVALFRNGINALVIDPWNEVSHEFGNTTETQYISKQLGKLRRFGRLNGIHIFIVAHPQKLQKNANNKYNAPDMYSIAGGAHFRNKADNGICVHRQYEEEKKRFVQIIIQKIRFRDIGKIGKCELEFEYATSLYRDSLTNQ